MGFRNYGKKRELQVQAWMPIPSDLRFPEHPLPHPQETKDLTGRSG